MGNNMQSIKSPPSWMKQVSSDLQRHEGFREFAYPDPLSPIGRKFPAGKKYRWGFRAATEILAELGLNPKDGFPWTVGYGFTRGVNERTRMSKSQADRMLEQEIYEHVIGLDKLADYNRWPLFAQSVLINMAFNMGVKKLSAFGNTLQLLRAGKWAEAGRNLRKTLWFKQVGKRSEELVQRLENGRIAKEHLV